MVTMDAYFFTFHKSAHELATYNVHEDRDYVLPPWWRSCCTPISVLDCVARHMWPSRKRKRTKSYRDSLDTLV